MLTTETPLPKEKEETVSLEEEWGDLDANFIKYKNNIELIDLKNFILDSIFKVNTYFNAYKFLIQVDLPHYQAKASRKAAEIFQTIRPLVNKIKESVIHIGDGYITGEEVFQQICDKNNSKHIQILRLIQDTEGKDYSIFKAHLERKCKSSYM